MLNVLKHQGIPILKDAQNASSNNPLHRREQWWPESQTNCPRTHSFIITELRWEPEPLHFKGMGNSSCLQTFDIETIITDLKHSSPRSI